MKIERIVLKTKVGEKRVFFQDGYYYAEIGEVFDIAPNIINTGNDLISAYYANSGEPHMIIMAQETGNKFSNLEHFFFKANKDKKAFPVGMNFNIVEKISKNIISVETFERGCLHKTNSCGTGSVASVAVLQKRNIISQGKIKVLVPGGEFFVECRNNKYFLITK